MNLPPLPVRPQPPRTTLPFRLRTLGRVHNQPHHVTAGTYHDDAMLSVISAGFGCYHRDGKVQRVGRGDLLLVLPGNTPGLLLADPEHPYEHYFCRFAGSEALRMASAIVAQRGPGGLSRGFSLGWRRERAREYATIGAAVAFGGKAVHESDGSGVGSTIGAARHVGEYWRLASL